MTTKFAPQPLRLGCHPEREARRSAPQEFAKTRDRLAAFLTYADNAAVGYFKKQGFTAAITLPRERVRTCRQGLGLGS